MSSKLYQHGKEKEITDDAIRLAAAFNGKSDSELMRSVEHLIDSSKEMKLTQDQRKAAEMIASAMNEEEN